jgi:hypothetical protein
VQWLPEQVSFDLYEKVNSDMHSSLFILPSRSALWSPVLADPGPNSIFTSVNGLFQSSSILPILRDAVSIITPLILAKNQSPKIMPKKRKGWTKIERIKADKGILASSAEHLMQLVIYSINIYRNYYINCFIF